MDGRLNTARLVAIAVLGFLLLNGPLLTIADSDATVGGIPVLYAYLFAVWAALIALIALVVRRR
jgi:predicted tellurium resistance membrane protein TerC